MDINFIHGFAVGILATIVAYWAGKGCGEIYWRLWGRRRYEDALRRQYDGGRDYD